MLCIETHICIQWHLYVGELVFGPGGQMLSEGDRSICPLALRKQLILR